MPQSLHAQSPCKCGDKFYFFSSRTCLINTAFNPWRHRLHLAGFLLLTDIADDRCYDQAVAPRPLISKEQLKAFLEKVKGDTSLQEKLKAAKSQDDVVSIAKDHGHNFGTEHISQLSEEELEGVAGGYTGCPYRDTCVQTF